MYQFDKESVRIHQSSNATINSLQMPLNYRQMHFGFKKVDARHVFVFDMAGSTSILSFPT